MDQPDGLVEGYVGAEQILIPVVVGNAGVLFDFVGVQFLDSGGGWQFSVGHE